jgi:hypothetical protein
VAPKAGEDLADRKRGASCRARRGRPRLARARHVVYHWAATFLEPETAKEHFETLSSGLTELLAAGPYGRTAFTPCIVEVCARAGRIDLALRGIYDALAFVEASNERAWSAELHRLRGELVKDVDLAEAERAMTRGLKIARRQDTRSFELRAALSLVKLNRQQTRQSSQTVAGDVLTAIRPTFHGSQSRAPLTSQHTARSRRALKLLPRIAQQRIGRKPLR